MSRFKVRNEAGTADEYYFSKVGLFGNRTSGGNFLRVAVAVCFSLNYLGFPCKIFVFVMISICDITTGGWLLHRGHPRSDLESLIGKLAHCAVCVRNGHLRLFHLRTSLRVSQSRNTVNISAAAMDELRWFLALAGAWNGRRSWPRLADELQPPAVHG